MTSGIVVRKGDWLSATVDGELVMMNAETGNYITISRVGGRIWEMIEQSMTVDQICSRLVDEFDVAPEVCRADVQRFLDEMVDNKAITIEESPPE